MPADWRGEPFREAVFSVAIGHLAGHDRADPVRCLVCQAVGATGEDEATRLRAWAKLAQAVGEIRSHASNRC